MKSTLIRKKYLDFFREHKHALVSSASVMPQDDPSVLFTTAGMQSLMPYLKGKKHPLGKRLTNIQGCIRTDDIDEVGDFTHHTFFEMLGSWSLGDYFKKEAIEWSYQFLTGEKWLNIDPKKLYVSVFKGDEQIPYDAEAAQIWKKQFAEAGIEALIYEVDKKTAQGEFRIFPLGKEDNWWGPVAETGPCGSDSEVFYYRGEKTPDFSQERLGFNSGNFVELWNNVFMEYDKTLEKDENGKKVFAFKSLKNKNVDTGAGLERITSITEGVFDDYKTDVFISLIKEIERASLIKYGEDLDLDKSMRIIADHIRAVIFIGASGVVPSNIGRGYILRRLLRRAMRHFRSIRKVKEADFVYQPGLMQRIILTAIEQFKENYPQLEEKKQNILQEIKKEEIKFGKTLERGMKKFEKIVRREEADNSKINGAEIFNLYQTYGFPLEMTEELAKERDMEIDKKDFKKRLEDHRKVSRQGMEKKFKGGLADGKEQTIKLHTAAHLMLAGLRKILGRNVHQKGSNINEERLRFDFSYPAKLTDEQKQRVEAFVNEVIDKDVKIELEEMSLEKAREQKAEGVFDDRYTDRVKVYTIGEYSKEICGGPHAKSTGELGRFKIVKEESSSAGVRRIKAVLE
jgi:alanyl-tRNA synthetase